MKKFKMPDSFTILFIIIILVGVLTWIVPSGEYVYVCNNGTDLVELETGPVCPVSQEFEAMILENQITGEMIDESLYDSNFTYTYQEIVDENGVPIKQSQGLWQILMAPIEGYYDAVDIAFFILIIGGFLGVVIATGAMDAGVSFLLIKFKGKEIYLIPVLMILFGLGGTSYGMAEESIAFYAIIIPVFLLAGFDALVGVMVIMLGAGIGVLASTVNPFAVGVASSAAGVSMGDGIVGRLVLWVILMAVGICYTMWYAKRVKKDIRNSSIYDLHEDIKRKVLGEKQQEEFILNRGRKVILTIFGITFVIMIMSVIPWEDFGITLFVDTTDWLNANMTILTGYAGAEPLGFWWFGELSMLFLASSIIIGFVASKYKILPNGFITEFINGAKDLITVALIIGLSRGIYVIMSSSGMDATLLYYGSEALAGLSKVTYTLGAFLFYIPMSFLIPSTSGLANATMPVMGPLGDLVYQSTTGIGAVNTITGYSAASGIVNLITPTSGVVMGGLAIAQIPYDRWIKHIIKFILFITVVCGIFVSIIAMLS